MRSRDALVVATCCVCLYSACSTSAAKSGAAAPAPVPPSQRIAPSEQTIVAEVDPSIDGQSIYIENRSTASITITSVHIYECLNVASPPCTLIPLQIRIGPGQRKRIAFVRAADRERAYSYRYSWTWGAAGPD
jgi:hypothetical protein